MLPWMREHGSRPKGTVAFQGAATTTTDTVCTQLTTCDFNTHWVSADPTTTTDRVCTPLTVCDTILTTDGTDNNQYISSHVHGVGDRQCASLTVCDVTVRADGAATQYESTAATESSDRVCQDTITCSATQELSGAGANATCVAKPYGGRRLDAKGKPIPEVDANGRALTGTQYQKRYKNGSSG